MRRLWGGCKESCADFDTKEKREQARTHLVGQLAERFSSRLLESVDALYENLVFNEAFGFLLFNYQPSCTDDPAVESLELVRVRDGQVQTVYRRAEAPPAPADSCQLPAEVVRQCVP